MSDVWSRYHLVLTGFLLALPVALLVVALRACALRARVLRVRVLRRGGEPVPEPPGAPLESAATRRSGPVRCAAFEVAAVYGTLPWLAMTLTPDPGAPRRIQLVPLHDLAALAGAPAQTVAVQLIGNLLVFAAAGFFLPLRYPALRSLPRYQKLVELTR